MSEPPPVNPCADCGLCCRELIIEIQHLDVVREPRLLEVAPPFQWDGEDIWERQYRLACGSSHPCLLLTADNRCSIYPTRPNACVGFEVGGEHCNELREEAGLTPIPDNLTSPGARQ